MEEHESLKLRKIHPEENANLVSNTFFIWQILLFFKSLNNTFYQENLFQTPSKLKAETLGNKLENAWNTNAKKSHALYRSIFQLFMKKILLYGFINMTSTLAIMIGASFAVKCYFRLILSEDEIENKEDLYKLCGIFAILLVFQLHIFNSCYHNLATIGCQIKIACSSLLYRKILETTTTTIDDGHMLNIIANDLNRFVDFPFCFVYSLHSIVVFVVTVLYLYFCMDFACAMGLTTVFPFLLFHYVILYKLIKYIGEFTKNTDARIQLTNELISSIQIIKMYTWERLFSDNITKARKLELKNLKKHTVLRLFPAGFKMFTNRINILGCFLIYKFYNGKLDMVNFISSTIVYESTRLLFCYLPEVVATLAECQTTILRLQTLLLAIQSPKQSPLDTNYKSDSLAIIQNLLFSGLFARNIHVKLSNNDVLTNVTFLHASKKLTAIVGPSGSGKTTLLNVFLHEIRLESGSLEVNGSVSYAPQEPWVFSASIRQNILFGSAMDRQRYKEVIRVCGLERDLSLWPRGDSTLAGERGVLMSGGQKARINLARAVYRQADIYLLDDPLSAVDAHVAQHIFRECIAGFLKNKCTVLVTHQVQFLKRVEDIYLLKNGQIQAKGNFQLLQQIEAQFRSLATFDKKINICEEPQFLSEVTNNSEISQEFSKAKKSGKYLKYCQAASNWPLALALITSFVFVHSLILFCDYYAFVWMSSAEIPAAFFYVLSSSLATLILLTYLRTYLVIRYCYKASVSLHAKLLKNIIDCKMRFFHTHPSGKIMNRFTRDMAMIDSMAPNLMETIQATCFTLFVSLFICVLIYWALIPTFLLYLIYISLLRLFIITSTNVEDADSSAKSALYSYFSTSLRGLSIIRAFKLESLLTQEFDALIDDHSSLSYLQMALQAAFCFWTEFINTIYIFAILCTMNFLLNLHYEINAGLIFVLVATLADYPSYTMINLGKLDNAMNATGHIVHYTKIPTEIMPSYQSITADYWPQCGRIQFANISMRYARELVIKNMNLEIKPREKIGIVGRTGAGKSSLISIIFHLCHFEGNLLIDSVDTKSINLKTLRSKIAIIPQDPVVFSGTIRENLDPFGELDDATLWQAIKDVQLKQTIAELDTAYHFSVGQKQLLCLARAILRDCKILILDEATANVDLLTDDLIQRTIREKFQKCTVITIAHRLSTIMHYDRVLVMHEGAAVEFDRPKRLLEDRNGFFSQLVNKSN